MNTDDRLDDVSEIDEIETEAEIAGAQIDEPDVDDETLAVTQTTPGEYVAGDEDAEMRIDGLIARLAEASRSLVAQAVESGDIRVGGRTVKGSYRIVPGDVISYALPQPFTFTVAAEELPLDIIFEDDTIIVVNKAAGMVTHPAHGSPSGTLVNALLAHTGTLPGDPVRPGLVHRLDRDTSGLLVVAKTAAALSTLGRAMQKRYITREYSGIVTGTPEDESGTLDGPLARDPQNRLRYAVRREGKIAVTHFKLREKLKGATELSFVLETGRTHQIRVHTAAYGHPILNDPLYGRRDRRVDLPGQVLHAGHLAFKHPATKEKLSFTVPPPAGYAAAKLLFV